MRSMDQKPGPETKFGAPETGKSGNAPSGSSSKDIAHDEGPAPVAVAYRRGARMAAHEAYLTHSTNLCARSIRAQSTAPHRRSCTASMPAPHGRRALRSKQKMSFEQGALLDREFRLRSARLVVSVTVSPRVSSRCTALNMSSRKIYVVIRFDSRKRFRVPLPPRPTAGLGFRLPAPPITGTTATGPPPTPVCRFSFRWSQELLH